MTFQTSYKALAGNIAKFRDLDCMPIQIDFKPLDERDGLENTFVRCKKKTRWHKSCCDLFNSTKLKQEEKRLARVNSRLVESIHVQLHLHLSTIAVHAFWWRVFYT